MRPDAPLPLRVNGASLGMAAAADAYAAYSHKARIAHPDGSLVIELRTDSIHLLHFFSHNWASACADASADGVITALRGDSSYYGLDPTLDGARWYYPQLRRVLFLASEAYANLKVTVRGLCSEVSAQNILWLHGCSLSLALGSGSHGIVLLGRSGGGKTTITATLRKTLPGKVKVVNDDWGAIALSNLRTTYTEESALHMKYMSANAHAPDLRPSPREFPSEHYNDDPTDPVPRLLVPPSLVFGEDGLVKSVTITALILLRRATSVSPGIRPMGGQAIQVIERGEYSDYYAATEPFFNGSLFLKEDSNIQRQRELYESLLAKIGIVALGNVEYPKTVARHLVSYLETRGRRASVADLEQSSTI